MNSSSKLPKVLILLLASCFIWIAGLSVAVTCFFSASAFVGWCISGGLVALLAVWFFVIAREINNAVELSDHFGVEATPESFVLIEGNSQFLISCDEAREARWLRRSSRCGRISQRLRSKGGNRGPSPRKPDFLR